MAPSGCALTNSTSSCGFFTGKARSSIDVHQAEEGGIGSDAQRQRKDRHHTERRRSRQRAGCIAQVLPERFESGERP